MTFLLSALGLLKRLPWWVWALLAVSFVAWRWHVGEVRTAGRAGYDRAMGEVRDKAERIRREANALTSQTITLQRRINDDERSRYDVEARRIGGAADDLRRLQPRQPALCPTANTAAGPGLPAGQQSPGGNGSPAVAQVPGRDWPVVVLPYQQTIDILEAADLNRAEVLSCRSAWERHRVAYERWREEWVKIGSGK